MLRNPPSCSFASFWIVSPSSFIDKPNSSRYLTIFKISSFSSAVIIIAVIPDPRIYFWIPASVAAAAVNPNGIKTLTIDLSTFFTKVKPVFSKVPRNLTKNPPDFPILYHWVFDNFVLAD